MKYLLFGFAIQSLVVRLTGDPTYIHVERDQCATRLTVLCVYENVTGIMDDFGSITIASSF